MKYQVPCLPLNFLLMSRFSPEFSEAVPFSVKQTSTQLGKRLYLLSNTQHKQTKTKTEYTLLEFCGRAFHTHTCIFRPSATIHFFYILFFSKFHLVKKIQKSRTPAIDPQDVHKLFILLLIKNQANPATFPSKVFLDSIQRDAKRKQCLG